MMASRWSATAASSAAVSARAASSGACSESLDADLDESIVFNFKEPRAEPWLSLGAAFSPVLASKLGWRPLNGLCAWQNEGYLPRERSSLPCPQ